MGAVEGVDMLDIHHMGFVREVEKGRESSLGRRGHP